MKLLNWLREPYKPQRDYLKENVETLRDSIDNMGHHAGVSTEGGKLKMKLTERILERMNNSEILKEFGDALDHF